jgi:O-methyltransferase/methyltransferase family protein
VTAPDPAPIIALLGGFRAAKFLMAATELGLFEALASSPADLGELAGRTGLTRRAARICADAMVTVGLIERDGDTYRNSPAAAAYLTGATEQDLRPFVRFSDRGSYPAWTGLAHALRHGPASRITDLDPETQAVFSAGVEALNAGPAAALAGSGHLARARRLLDIGGGTGSWSIAAAAANPHLLATVFELPQVAGLARKRIAEHGLSDRIGVAEGEVLTTALPEDHDTCLLANVVHCFSPADNRRLLATTRASVTPGTRLLMVDYWTDPTHTVPPAAAMMAGEYALASDDGDVYSTEEATAWLTGTGWRFVDQHPLDGPKSVIVAEAV